MDELRIDSHKLIYHVPRVDDWLRGRDVYPIYIEVSPIGACNHRCTFCALDYMEYRPDALDAAVLKERLAEMGRLGVKSIMYAGEGEPLLHREIADIVAHTKRSGIDAAVTSNGVCLTEKTARAVLPHLTWIKISINAGTPGTYAAVHGTGAGDFHRVMENTAGAVRIRRELGLGVTIGMQMILLPENASEAAALAAAAKEAGADYLVVKAYSQHRMSRTERYRDLRYSDFMHLQDELAAFRDERFNVVFRAGSMRKLERGRRYYEKCQALPFWSYVDSRGGLWGCSAYLGDERFLYGNIYDTTFEEAWKGERRKEVLRLVAEDLDTDHCRINCRMDEVNRYLWELRHPPAHVNFI
ncbi:MAG TPA: radical SAM protein [Deltaproteobacteria bacterium]|nr:radical SAM protein [Deltaproteobacteria bacterium]